ncbi:hypothetical protein R5R35_007296 [Gryllus longicercus]|uniref:G-protein coupled receptors family 1 profile domain-containing protein n=1 Tax=Gryllus longicercus TaxID=2509291 RepID=A0AAN9V7D3_9ORTH
MSQVVVRKGHWCASFVLRRRRAMNGSGGNLSVELAQGANASGGLKQTFTYDRVEVRVIFIIMYTIVFCCCFFGNMLVILVVTISRRLRSITNFFLANLAVADLCVGVFCVYQNLFIYLMDGNWVLGATLCKMFLFVQNLSYTASILILMVISLERYVAIIHPIACRQILTPNRLVLVVIGVWCVAAVYSSPRLAWMNVVEMKNVTVCIPAVRNYNMPVYDTVNLLLLYVVPLVVMSLLYAVIASELWHSTSEFYAAANPPVLYPPPPPPPPAHPPPPPPYSSSAAAEAPAAPAAPPTRRATSFRACFARRLRSPYASQGGASGAGQANGVGAVKAAAPAFTQNVLRARRGVVRMLIVVVVTFALCNLPIHVRKLWQHGGNAWGYYGNSEFSRLLTPLTFLLTYVNSGINPLLYAFMSRNFRKGLREVVCGPLRGARPAALAAPTSSIRRSSTRSTSRNVSVVTVHS